MSHKKAFVVIFTSFLQQFYKFVVINEEKTPKLLYHRTSDGRKQSSIEI